MFGPIHPEIIRCSRCCNPWSPDGHVCGDLPKGAVPAIRWIAWPFMSECPKDEATYQAGLALHRQREHNRKIADAWDVFLREVGAAMTAACVWEMALCYQYHAAAWGTDVFDLFIAAQPEPNDI